MIEYLLYRAAGAITRMASLRTAYRIGGAVSFFYYHLLRKKERETLKENLRVVFPGRSGKEIEACARENFREFGKFIAEFLSLDRLTPSGLEAMVRFSGEEFMDAAAGSGRGVLAISAHIGNWELGAARFAMKSGSVHAVALDHEQERVNEIFVSRRERKGVRVISVSSGMREVFRVLKDGGVLAVMGDRDVTGQGMEVEFFGKPAVFPRGAAVLSRRTGALILPVFNIRRDDGTYELAVHEPFAARPDGDNEAAEREALERWVKIFESYVRRHPAQWFMYHGVWPR